MHPNQHRAVHSYTGTVKVVNLCAVHLTTTKYVRGAGCVKQCDMSEVTLQKKLCERGNRQKQTDTFYS